MAKSMTLGQKQRLFTLLVSKLVEHVYDELGYELTYGEVQRTREQQEIYVKQGKSQTMNSKHLQRLAVDFNLFIDGKYRPDAASYAPLGEFWKSLSPMCKWGGDWKTLVDANHFELG